MPSPRSAQELLRVFQAVDSPIYVLGEDRQIVLVNKACAKWLETDAGELQGRVCRFQSADADPLAALADALSPLPEVFHGQRGRGVLLVAGADAAIKRRRAEFVPLLADDGTVVGVLALVEAADLPEEEDSVFADAASSAVELDEAAKLHELVQRFRAKLAGRHRLERLAGASTAMQRVRSQVEVAAGCRAAVLMIGPAGSGKQHVAATIHFAGPKPAGAMTPISCSALPGELLLSTLSALAKRHAKASEEGAGTLLLTDVQAMPLEVQAEAAKWLSSGPKNLRVIATAPEPLLPRAEQGAFRADLAMLLGTLTIELPSLRSRREDIPTIAQMLLEDCNAEAEARQLRGFTPGAMDRLAAYDWPGEIDEFAKLIGEAHRAAEGFEITEADLPKKLRLAAEAARFPRKTVEPIDLEKFLAQIERELIERAMKQTKGNKTQVARLLGLSRPRLYRRMVQLGLAQETESEIEFEELPGEESADERR